MSDAPPTTFTRKQPKAWRIVVGLVLLVGGALISANPANAPENLPLLVAGLTAIWLVMGFGVWLIASGIPKWLGPQAFMDARRFGWQRLLGLGFVVMAGVALGLVRLSLGVGAVVVAWVYWFGWTWISWRMADRRARRQFGAPLSPAAPTVGASLDHAAK